MVGMRLALSLLGLACSMIAVAAPAPAVRAAVRVDHLILGIGDLDAGIRQFEERTGVRPKLGGEHPGRGTRNALVSLGADHYIEILAPQPGAPPAEAYPGLPALTSLTPLGWAVSVRDLDDVRRRIGDAGFGLSEVKPGSRARPDGTLLEWKTFEVTKPALGAIPFFIRWGDSTTHPSMDSPTGCRLERLRVVSPNAEDVRRLFAALPLDVAVDAGARGALELTLACPNGPVTFRGTVGG
jgi:glyoxalase-like protein